MTMFRNTYDCPCGTHWTDDWSATCDDRCPVCDTSCSPTSSEELTVEISPMVIMNFEKIEQRMMEQIVGVYGVSSKGVRGHGRLQIYEEIYNSMIQFPQKMEPDLGMVYDPLSMLDDMELLEYGTFEFPKTNVPDWKRTKFVSGGETPPDAKKRAQLRAKRKKSK